ncbi:TVP38/TMEM64 family protein [Lactobacillus sp. PV034]|uniref:TVP38/TMEM64 family protein n=1 Tax=Lactobacillus sp. PV034 TaxID=2594495 RepID=UPI00223F9757|nr:VTT domain-containing protein [Lactobacillus sp. PV034]QNQ81319.1 TVP38/TMEM64 family protein [Lactobacillus sp. PV034]
MKQKLLKILLIVLGIAAAICLLYFLYQDYRPEIQILLHPERGNIKEKLLVLLRQHETGDILFLMCLIMIFNAIPGLSNSIFCILAGLCYGPWLGLLINWCGNILGNSIVCALINKMHFSHSFKKNRVLTYLMHRKHPIIGMTIGLMIPVIPSVLVDYTAVRLKTPVKNIIAMIVVGMLPTSFIYAFGGDALFSGDIKRIASALAALVILIGLALVIFQLASHHDKEKSKTTL